ncbi:hypothetical protein AXX17_ATUG00540 [Arabidopsis thaliana]|uniref:Uncharacterized protein n=1 Tax=Arabidopsis thaliana TaxID=3702 RepID=A0A178U6G2_ARATH|nr:hypothetical protein AXX17_ATUG00540 [Arabidopsis thaliana]
MYLLVVELWSYCNMDKSWIWLPRSSLEYEQGATDFVESISEEAGKEYEDQTNCPRCSASRWELDKHTREEKKGIPAKVLRSTHVVAPSGICEDPPGYSAGQFGDIRSAPRISPYQFLGGFLEGNPAPTFAPSSLSEYGNSMSGHIGQMSAFEDSQNKSNHSYGDDESSSETRSTASLPQVQRRVITLDRMGPVRPMSTRADKPKKKKAAKQKGGTLMTNSDLVKTNARSDHGTYYISARPGSLVLGGLKACRDTNWRSKYFFFRVDRHSIGSFDPARMTTRTKEVTLSETELQLLTLLRRVPPDSSSTSELPLIRRRMRRPSLRVQQANTEASARVVDLSAAARNTLAVSSTSASPSHPSLPEINTEPLLQQRARTLPEVHPAAELVMSDQGVASPIEERAEPAAANLEAARSPDRQSLGRSQGGRRGCRGGGRSLNRSQEVRQTSNSSGGYAGSRPFYWSYTHDRDHPIVEDEAGFANLLRHIKGRNCQVPRVKNMAKAAAYADMMAKEVQAIAATNKLVALYEQRLSQIGLMEIEIGGLKADKQTARNQIHRLEQRREELSKRVTDVTSTAQGAMKAVHDAKVELAAAYSKLLAGIKEKWVAKKEYTVLESHAAEVELNLALIDYITKAAIDLTVERPRLQAGLDDLRRSANRRRPSAWEGFHPFVYCFLNLVPGKAFILCSVKYLDAWEGFYPF